MDFDFERGSTPGLAPKAAHKGLPTTPQQRVQAGREPPFILAFPLIIPPICQERLQRIISDGISATPEGSLHRQTGVLTLLKDESQALQVIKRASYGFYLTELQEICEEDLDVA